MMVVEPGIENKEMPIVNYPSISFLLFLNLIFFKKMKMEREDGDWIIIGSGISFLSNAMFSTNSKPLIGEHSKG